MPAVQNLYFQFIQLKSTAVRKKVTPLCLMSNKIFLTTFDSQMRKNHCLIYVYVFIYIYILYIIYIIYIIYIYMQGIFPVKTARK